MPAAIMKILIFVELMFVSSSSVRLEAGTMQVVTCGSHVEAMQPSAYAFLPSSFSYWVIALTLSADADFSSKT